MLPKSHLKNYREDMSDTISSSTKLHGGSLNSYTTASTEDSSGKKCQICKKGFMLRRKITCHICLNVFCSDHCQRKRHMPGSEDLVQICDSCEEEETKKEIADEIDAEISKLTTELREVKETNEKLFREHFTKATLVNDLEMEIKKQEWNQKKQEQGLLSTLELEQSKGQKLRVLIDQLRNTLEDLNTSERLMADECVEAEVEVENLKLIEGSWSLQTEEISGKIENLNKALRESLGIDQVRRILCQPCLGLLSESLKTDIKSPERLVEVYKDYHRESLMSSPDSKKKCVIF